MFEQSLRTRLYPVTPAQNGHNPGLNPEFHRGCTGKAHACGTVKSRLNRINNNSNNTNNTTTIGSSSNSLNHNSNNNNNNSHGTSQKNGVSNVATHSTNTGGRVIKSLVQRKNSISSETISDSGSENSAPSWLDATDCSAAAAVVVVNNNKNNKNNHVNIDCNLANEVKTPEANRKRLLQLRKLNISKNMPTIVNSSVNCKSNNSKLLHARSIVARNLPTSTTSPSTINEHEQRRRLHSEGDRASETGASTVSTSSTTNIPQKQAATFERIQKCRSFRVGSSNINNNTNKQITRPPWNSGSSSSSSHANKNISTPVIASPSSMVTFNSRNYRNSFRRRNTVDWPAIWERSFALRGYGINSGLYKNYNEAIKLKVGKANLMTISFPH